MNAHTRRLVVLVALAALILVPLLGAIGGALR